MEKKRKYTSDEFLAATELEGRYELVSGELYDMSPSPNYKHQLLAGGLYADIRGYIRKNSGECTVLIAPSDVRLDDKNTVQPDVFVVCDRDKFDEHGCVGAPDWVIEILSPGNSNHDTVVKLGLYMKTGVREYWIVDPMSERVIVHTFEKANTTGIYTFEDDIPVWIYKDNEHPLSIKIKDVLQ